MIPQILKGLYSYLPPRSRQVLSVFTKLKGFQRLHHGSVSGQSTRDADTCLSLLLLLLELLDDIRKFSMAKPGTDRSVSNFLVMMQLMQVMNSSGMEESDTSGTELAE